MASLRLCRKDPVVKVLHETLRSNVVRVPNADVAPLTVVAHRGRQARWRGKLAPLLKEGPLQVPSRRSPFADLKGQSTSTVEIGMGLKILAGLLDGFGIRLAPVKLAASRATHLAFSFDQVERRSVDLNVLGQKLVGRRLENANPAANLFLGKSAWDLLVIDSILASQRFAVHLERRKKGALDLDAPALTSALGANVALEASSADAATLTFNGERPLTFAFTCVRFELNAEGEIYRMPPASTGIHLEARRHAPAVVRIADHPTLLSLDSRLETA